MKVRLVIVEADDVSPGDVSEIVRQISGAGAVSAPALPAVAPLPAAFPGRPPAVPTALAPSSPGWRPRARRGRKPKGDPDSSTRDPQPTTAEIVQCGNCSADLPEGKDRRSSCPKCGRKQWEVIPARSAQPHLPDPDDE